MKQILQNLGSGETILAEVPTPMLRDGQLLIQTRCSLVSIGTERMLLDFGKAGWIDKARQQPDKLLQVIQKAKNDGFIPTVAAVRSKLDQPIPLGYCNVGVVVDSRTGADFASGQRVVSNGPHATIVSVPKNLCAKVPEVVSDEAAAFTVVGSIGLQGIRLLAPSLGETVVVTGLGLIGLLSVQILRANGCRVIGIDYDSTKCKIAAQLGAHVVDLSSGQDPLSFAADFTAGVGVDGVLITASTQSSEPVHQAAVMCRKRGRIVLVGVTGLELARADFYEKELTFQVSCSYGPGRYDEQYEQSGADYPIGFVRWTEQRNFEAFLNLLADRRIDVKPLISHRFEFERAVEAYRCVGDKAALGIILDYPKQDHKNSQTVLLKDSKQSIVSSSGSGAVIGLIGAGGFTSQVLLPALRQTGARLKVISSSGGVTGTHLGRKFGFEASTTDNQSVFEDPEINTVMITTRHNSHANLVVAAIAAGKRAYVEKPLCLTRAELEQIKAAVSARQDSFIMVGFNRRFAPHIVKIKELLKSVGEPKTMIMTVNAGFIPRNHWTQDPNVGGGRIIGEACHHIDLLRHLAGNEITSVVSLQSGKARAATANDCMSFTLKFEDGSIGTVHYFSNGHKAFPKERLEIFAGGRILQLDNFRKLVGYGWRGFSRMNLWTQDKGHRGEIEAFVDAILQGKPAPIPFKEIIEITEASFDVVELL